MSPDRWNKIDQLLDVALELPQERRASFLQVACADDDELRNEVESLLAAHENSGSFIETTPAKGVAAALAKHDSQLTPQTMVGRKLGHYEIIALLGAGGMGEVYRARDPRLDRNVAIKVLPQHLSKHPDALNRFEREAKAIAALSHPNILSIHDFGHEDGTTFAVMELLEGETLRARLDHSSLAPLSWREAVKITASVADGLAAAHAKGIIHRDIKPENIFLTADGLVKVLDFGIARIKRAVVRNAETLISQGINETKPGTLMGTIGYMSPEQVRGDSADAPSDIFSLGCVLVEMLTGERPFARHSAAETMAAILRDQPPALDAISQDIPIEMERIVNRCLEKTPEERFQSARDLALDLRSLLTNASGFYRSVNSSIGRSHPLAKTRHRRFVQSGLAVLAIVLVIAGVQVWKSKRQSDPAVNSLAVLPLVNVSQDPNTDFLSEGVTETIIGNLAPLRPKLRVLARSSVIGYKGKEVDPRKVGRELNVRTLLVGRILQQGDLLVIRVELVDTLDGTQLWSEQYERKRADVLAIQEEISQQISEKLRLNLTGEEQKLLTKRNTNNFEAYYLYLNGRYFWNQRSDQSLETAIDFYQRAISLDPNYAQAYAGMADSYALLYDGGPKRDEARRKSELFALKALSLDANLAEAHATLGFIKTFRDWDWTAAEANFKRSLTLNPDYATAHHWYSILLLIQGRLEAASEEIKRAKELEPRSFPINKDIGELLFFERRYDDAIAQFRRTIESEPTNSNVDYAHFFIRNAYDQKGDLEAAIKELHQTSTSQQEIAELKQAFEQGGANKYWQKRLEIRQRNASPHDPKGRMRLVLAYAAAGNVEQAMPLLEKAINEDRHDGVLYLKTDPRFDNLRSHPRFPELLKQMKLS